MTPYTVLMEIEVVRNYVINNFKLLDQLSRIHNSRLLVRKWYIFKS